MHEEKSRGSGRGSRKTRVGYYGWVTRVKVQPWQSRENGSARLLRSRHGASRVGWLSEYMVVFRRFWPVLALARDGRVSGNGLGFERILEGDWLEREGE
ncbi:hypothetical protein CRG98_025550 [Punica granatum]|uniref:Uncharacterized protein n=1 Tax=Punica granatum TaxID=22663 RepID=A0A2I0JEG3_PUNGR|nr:hypothetical protein CRG98_025550 [Punica granatum]